MPAKNQFKITESIPDELIQEYLTGASLGVIANTYNVSRATAAQALRRQGVQIKKRGNTETTRFTKLTQKEIEIIHGELLGDGSLRKTPTSITKSFTHTSIHKDYSDFLISSISVLKDAHIRIGKDRYVPRERRGKGEKYQSFERPRYVITSKSDKCFDRFWNCWYPNGKKVLPVNLKLTPTMLLHWYLGDGCLRRKVIAGRTYYSIYLATHCFTIPEIDYLIDNLGELDILGTRHASKSIYIGAKFIDTFFNVVGSPPVKSLAYRWI